ncbi:MAG: PQQ-dependent sugar dehydrogenase [Acidimicrobiia bacterium]
MKRFLGVVVAVVVVAALAVAGIYGVKRLRERSESQPGLFVPAAMATSIAALPDGGFLYGEQRSGRVFEIGPDGTARGLVAEVDVATNGDRGLRGLAVDATGHRRFASWVAPDGRFRVGELTPGGVVVVWDGPLTGERGNGGRIVWAPRGVVVFGVGNQDGPNRSAEPASLLGRLLLIAPVGPPTQVPATLSSGWNDPGGLTYDPAGHLWVADGSAAVAGARIARGDVDGRPTEASPLSDGVSPVGLAATDADDLVTCNSAPGSVQRYSTAGGRAELTQDQVTPCRYDVAVLADGRWAIALDDGIRVEDPPSAGTGAN